MWLSRGGGRVAGVVAGVLLVAVAAAAAVQDTEETASSRILVVDLFGTRSHKHFIMAVAEQLAKRNHSVTYYTNHQPKQVRTNIKEVFLPDVITIFNQMSNLFHNATISAFSYISHLMHKFCVQGLNSTQFQRIQEEKFDLVILSIVHTECFVPFIHKLQVPWIFISPNSIQGTYAHIAGTPFFPSLVGNHLLHLELPLSFTGRMISTLFDTSMVYFTFNMLLPKVEAYCKSLELCPDGTPSLAELIDNASILITNSVRTMERPTLPYTPTVVHAGGVHCRPSQPLPKDLKEWAEGSGDAGFILFSLGSIVKPSEMPEKYRRVLVKVFASLEQRVLWKWHEETMEGLSPNVRLSKWLPQQDILGHPKLRLFMTHGGLLSLQEATYHGVPVLGFPVFMDQRYNMQNVDSTGWGRFIIWEDLTYDGLRNNILDIIHNATYREVVQHLSSVMRDQPVPPGDWAAYWIEYVIRHRGATHLRCPATRMPWYELYNLDVWVCLVVVTVTLVVLVCFLTYKSFRCLLACCRPSKKTKRE